MGATWDAGVLTGQPYFADIERLLAPGRFRDWPDVSALDALIRSRSVGAAPPRLVLQPPDAGYAALDYARRIAEHDEVPTRARSWHDFFNACMWALFPTARRRLNAIHLADADRTRRSPRRDAATLLDECGVILATSNPCLRALHARHRWRDLFWHCRDQWGATVAPLILGHGLCEQLLNPYIGLTAKAYYLRVPEAWFAASPARRYRWADALLDAELAARSDALSTTQLLPLPVLGIPDYDERNRAAGYYANEAYFRPWSERHMVKP